MQGRLWVHGGEDEMSSFTEAVCTVFDDAGATRAMESGYLRKNYSLEFCCNMDELDRLVGLVPDSSAPEETMEHPEMESIRLASRRLLELLDDQRTF